MDMIAIKGRVLTLVQRSGPILPIKLCNELKITTIFAGAILSDLIGSGKVKISSAKIGSSPLYYVIGQEDKLEVLYSHLKDPEKKAYDLLKENKILEDSALTPLQRVALREIKDFAVPLNLTTGQIFWKFHLIEDNEAEVLIKAYLSPPETIKEEIRPIEETKPRKEELKQEIPVQKEVKKELPVQEEIKPLKQSFAKEPEPKEKIEAKIKEKKQKKERAKSKKYSISEIVNFLDGKGMRVLNEELIKNNEYNFDIHVKSQLGMLKYLLKFSSKKSVSDKDLILAQHEATSKKLPLIYLSPGKVSENARKYAEMNNIVVQNYG